MGRPKVDSNDRFNPSVVKRFFEKTKETETGCLEWTGTKDKDGYGRFQVSGREGKKEYAHRWSLENSLQQTLPAEIKACHSCDNPSCVDPKHLFQGTQKDNMQDAAEKGRTAAGMGMCKFSDQEIRDIRNSSETNVKLAKDCNVSKVTISNIRTGKTYQHVN